MANPQSCSQTFIIRTKPGKGVDYTPNSGNLIDALQGANKCFDLITISNQAGNNSNYSCGTGNNFEFFAGGGVLTASSTANNGSIKYNFSNSQFISDPSGGSVDISVMWNGSEAGLATSNLRNGVASNPSQNPNSFDQWRFNVFISDVNGGASGQSNLFRIQTAIPNAPVISIPTRIDW